MNIASTLDQNRPVTGETDLLKMLASLRIERREDPVTVVHLPEPVSLGHGVMAVIEEAEGTMSGAGRSMPMNS